MFSYSSKGVWDPSHQSLVNESYLKHALQKYSSHAIYQNSNSAQQKNLKFFFLERCMSSLALIYNITFIALAETPAHQKIKKTMPLKNNGDVV